MSLRLVTLIAGVALSTCANAQNEAGKFIYMVRITKTSKHQAALQTGFRLGGTKGIVTSLHGVVDGTTFSAFNEAGDVLVGLTVSQVDIRNDTALLRSNELLERPADGLPTSPSSALLPNQELRVLGHPAGINLYNKRVVVGLPPTKTLYELVPPASSIAFAARKSPDEDAKVLNLEGNLVPGDSGAPVLDAKGRVIGVVDGGLLGGAAAISWAIPVDALKWRDASLATIRISELAGLEIVNLFAFAGDDENSQKPETTGDPYIDNVLKKISVGERNPNWSEAERASALQGLFERDAFHCSVATESWPEMLWAVAATRIVIEDNIPSFAQHPEIRNHLNDAAGLLGKMQADVASLWGSSIDPTAAIHKYFHDHDEFIRHLPSMMTVPDKELEVKRRQKVAALRGGLQGYLPIATDRSCDDGLNPQAPDVPRSPDSSWTDPVRGLTWAIRDNGKNVSWIEAQNVCRDLRIDDSAEWRLPTINELATLFDSSSHEKYWTYHGETSGGVKEADQIGNFVKAPVELHSCCAWSQTQPTNSLPACAEPTEKPGENKTKAYYYRFQEGNCRSFRIGSTGLVRALCVRGPVGGKLP